MSSGRRKKLVAAAVVAAVVLSVAVLTVLIVSAKVTFISDPGLLTAGDYTDSPAMADVLNQIFAGDIDLFDGSTEVSYAIGSTMNNSKMYSVVSKTGNRLNGYQCYIYANAVYNKLFGEYIANGNSSGFIHSVNVLQNAGNTASYELFKQAGVRCGAYMRTTENTDGSYSGSKGHSLVIMKYDENEITYIEGNGEGKGYVRGAILSWSDFNARQLSGRKRYICNVTQPTESYYNQVYGSSTVKLNFNKGSGTGTVPSSISIKYRDSFALPSGSTLTYADYDFAGWSAKRPDKDLYADTKGGWSSSADINSGKAQKKIFSPGSLITFDSYWYKSGGVHMTASETILFTAEFAAPPTPTPEPTPRPEGPFTLRAAAVRQGDTVVYDIYIDKNPGCAYLEITLGHSDGLVLESLENGDVLGGMYTGDVITWKMAGDLYGTGRLLRAYFRVDGPLAPDASISFNVIKCCGEIGDVEFTPMSSSAAVK